MIFWLLSYTTMASDDAFYTDNNAALRNASEVKTLERSCLLEEYYEIDRCIDWLNTHTKVQRVSLSFTHQLTIWRCHNTISMLLKLQQPAACVLGCTTISR